MAIKLFVNGQRGTINALRILEQKVEGLAEEAVHDAFQFALKEVHRLVPVKDGHLKRGITLKKVPDARTGVAVSMISTPSRNDLSIPAGRPYYPALVEYGTDRMTAQPYMRPAMKNTEARLVKAFNDKFIRDMERSIALLKGKGK